MPEIRVKMRVRGPVIEDGIGSVIGIVDDTRHPTGSYARRGKAAYVNWETPRDIKYPGAWIDVDLLVPVETE